jgi:hypothetical protein
MRFPIHALTIAALGIVLVTPARAEPTCKRLSDAQLAAALASADQSIQVVSEAARAPEITTQVASNWNQGESALDAFFARTSDIALKSRNAQFAVRDAMDRGGSSLDSILEVSGGVEAGSETSRLSAPHLLLANRKRVTAMLRAIPHGEEAQSEAFQAAVLELKKSGNQFINLTTSLLAHYNCDAMAKNASDHLVSGGTCLDPPIPLAPLYGASVAPVQDRCLNPAAVSGVKSSAKPLLYSAPNSQESSLEGGSSSSGGAK